MSSFKDKLRKAKGQPPLEETKELPQKEVPKPNRSMMQYTCEECQAPFEEFANYFGLYGTKRCKPCRVRRGYE